jgi:ketosteroid isomerase-like protein
MICREVFFIVKIKKTREGEDTLSRKIAVALTLLASLVAISMGQAGQNSDQTKPAASNETLMQVDQQFAKMAADSGIGQAFAFFAADSAAMLRRGSAPIVGRDAIRELYTDTTGAVLRWAPYFADIAASGDLGYTLGKSQFIYKDSTGAEKTSHGYYVTIWKRQPDGSWKYVLDTGVSAPPPK